MIKRPPVEWRDARDADSQTRRKPCRPIRRTPAAGFRPDLLEAVIEQTNALEPDLIAIVSYLSETGHLRKFEEAKDYLDRLGCADVLAIGNGSAKNVGYRYFEYDLRP